MQTQPTNTIKRGIALTVLPFSISSLSAYETCPRRFYLVRSKQASEKAHESNTYGNEVHKALELAVKGTAALPARFAQYQPIVTRVLAMPGEKQAERNFAVNSAFRPVDYWDRSAWVRGKIDVTVAGETSAVVLDYKTGKVKDDPDQLRLTAAAVFAERPYLKTVRTGYVWLAHDKLTAEVVKREDVPGIWQAFLPRVARMKHSADTDDFPPKPNGLCRAWCPVGKALCEHCGS